MAKKEFPDESDQVEDLYFASWAELDAPLAVNFINYYKASREALHRHVDFNELIIVLGGSCCHQVGSRMAFMKPGAILFMKSNSFHQYTSIRSFVHYNVLFKDEALRGLPEKMRYVPGFRRLFVPDGQESEVFYLDKDRMYEIVNTLEKMRRELASRKPGWQPLIEAGFTQMVIELSRDITSNEPAGGLEEHVFQMTRALHYMEKECCRNVKIKDLSMWVGMSESKFRHRFVEITGFSPFDYLLRLRLKKALYLLQTGIATNEAARQCGFADGAHFSKLFGKFIGLTPKEIRKRFYSGESSPSEVCLELFAPPAVAGKARKPSGV